MNRKKTLLKNTEGLSILYITSVLMLLALLALAASSLISERSLTTGEASNSLKAFYIAEAGLAVAKHTLRADWSKINDPSSFPATSFAGGTFDAEVTPGADASREAIITVTGLIGNSRRRIQSWISRYGQAMLSAIYTNGDFSMSGSASVNGNVVSTDTQIPSINTQAAIAAARANRLNGFSSRPDGNYFLGNFSSSPTSLNGVIFIDTFPSGSPASVELSGNVSTTDGHPAFLIIFGNLRISGNVTFKGLIYTTGSTDIDTTLTGNMWLDGGLITSGDVTMQGNSDATYNEDMVITDMTAPLLQGEDVPQEVSWRELNL